MSLSECQSKMDSEETDFFSVLVTPSDNICNHCNIEFVDDEELSHHILSAHQSEFSKARFCVLCKTLLPSIENYAKHVIKDHLNNLEACEFCCRVFSDYDKLQYHIAKHRTSKQIGRVLRSCSQCPEIFDNIEKLTKHESDKHENHEGIMLSQCFPHMSSILCMKAQTFLRSLRQPYTFTCVVCCYSNINYLSYLKHLKFNHKDCFACNDCASPFKTLAQLRMHINIKSCKKDVRKCRFCKTTFSTDSLLSHELVCKNTLECKFCGVKANSVLEMTEHQVKEHPSIVSIVVCKYCQKNCPGEKSLQNHIERTHKPDLHLYKYICKKCDFYFKHPKNLFGHLYTTHKDLEPYRCMICNENYRLRKQFSIHIRKQHNNIGFIEFDENFFVNFGNKKDVLNVPNNNNEKVSNNSGLGNTSVTSNLETEAKSDSTLTASTVKPAEKDTHIKNKHVKTKKNIDKNEKVLDEKECLIDDTVKKEYISQDLKHYKKYKLKNTVQGNIITKSTSRSSSENEDIPLNELKKKKIQLNKKIMTKRSKFYLPKNFTCPECNKKCYTFNNYNNHLQMHGSKYMKQCIKCGMVFKRTIALQNHIKSMHNNSKLTVTLQKLIEKRNQSKDIQNHKEIILPQSSDIVEEHIECEENISPPLTVNTKFELKVKKVNLDDAILKEVRATIRETTMSNTNNVKIYLETFKSDIDKKDDTVKITKTHCEPNFRIKMTKVNLKPYEKFTQLCMPVKFRQYFNDQQKAKLKVVLEKENDVIKQYCGLKDEYDENGACDEASGNYADHEDDFPLSRQYSFDQTIVDQNVLPEVAQEVSVEESSRQKVREIILPECAVKRDVKEVSIAVLKNQAPFYEVVKVKTLLNGPKKRKHKPKETNFEIPQSLKLVNVNPLQHLLKGKEIKIEESSDVKENYDKLIAKALLDLEAEDDIASKSTPRKKTEKKKRISKKNQLNM